MEALGRAKTVFICENFLITEPCLIVTFTCEETYNRIVLFGMKFEEDAADIWLAPIPFSSSNCTELQFKVDAAYIGGLTVHQISVDKSLTIDSFGSFLIVGFRHKNWKHKPFINTDFRLQIL